MTSQIKSVMKKEFLHILNDVQTLFIIIVMPLIMIFLYGNAITLDMRNITTIIRDHSQSPQSRTLVRNITSSGFFKITAQSYEQLDVDTIFRRRLARCLMVIPQDFSIGLATRPLTPVQLVLDASDPNAGKFIYNYMSMIVSQYNADLSEMNKPFISLTPRFLYNPDQRSSSFFVPGLISIILLMVSAMLTSIAIVREKERGSMEQILVSPITPIQLIIGKIFPYILLGLLDGVMILIAGIYAFKVPMEGSVSLLILMMLLYIFTGLSMGLLISTIARTQQVAMLMSLMISMLPTLLLSGFMFPVESMPMIFQWLSRIVPATHFIQIIRGVMLKGVGVAELVHQISYLALLSTFLIVVSVKKFKTDLEH